MFQVEEDTTYGGDPTALAVRSAGYACLGALAAFVANAWLSFWIGLPGPLAFAENGVAAGLQLALYPALMGLGVWFVFAHHDRALRTDSRQISDFNAWLIRCLFWGVFLVGLADGVISFLRVEGLLEPLFGDQMARDLSRSLWRGPYIHMPIMALGFVLGSITRTLGFTWLALLIVLAELLIVISRFVFSYEQAFMGDLVRFWYAALFLFASAYTLLEEGHVRVDVFYAAMRTETKGMVNAVGSVVLGILLCWVVLIIGLGAATSVITAPMIKYETTQAGVGLFVKYLMAGFLGVFAITMMIQFVSYLFEAVADMRDEPGKREIAEPGGH